MILGGFDGDATAWRMLEEGTSTRPGSRTSTSRRRPRSRRVLDVKAGKAVPPRDPRPRLRHPPGQQGRDGAAACGARRSRERRPAGRETGPRLPGRLGRRSPERRLPRWPSRRSCPGFALGRATSATSSRTSCPSSRSSLGQTLVLVTGGIDLSVTAVDRARERRRGEGDDARAGALLPGSAAAGRRGHARGRPRGGPRQRRRGRAPAHAALPRDARGHDVRERPRDLVDAARRASPGLPASFRALGGTPRPGPALPPRRRSLSPSLAHAAARAHRARPLALRGRRQRPGGARLRRARRARAPPRLRRLRRLRRPSPPCSTRRGSRRARRSSASGSSST